jgi:hypothetical protein
LLSPTFGIINLANLANKVESHCGLNFFSLITKEVSHLFIFSLFIFLLCSPYSFLPIFLFSSF